MLIDLCVEIGHTDNLDYRGRLKRQEEPLRDILDRLGASVTASSSGVPWTVAASPAQLDRTPSERPTFVNAPTARAMCSGRCAADSCTRMRERPLGTTGKKKPFT